MKRPLLLPVERLEDRIAPALWLGGVAVAAVDLDGDGRANPITAAGPGARPQVTARAADGSVLQSLHAFAHTFDGGVNVAAGDLDGDDLVELIVAAGAGGGPHVRVVNPDGDTVRSFFAYADTFQGGVNVAAGDLNGDGLVELVTAPGVGGAPHVRVFGANGAEVLSFFAFEESFRGGATVAVDDVTGDGRADLIVGAGKDGGPRIRVYDGRTGEVTANFFAYADDFRGGVTVAAGDLDGDGVAEIITGAGAGGGPHVRAFRSNGVAVLDAMAFDAAFRGGADVAAGDLDGDGRAELLVGAGVGGGPHVVVLDGRTGAVRDGWFAFPPGLDQHRALHVPATDGPALPVRLTRLASDSAFSNEFGAYRVDAPDGRIGSLRPGDAGYAAAALTSERVASFFRPGESVRAAEVSLTTGADYGFYLVQNASLDTWRSTNSENALTGAPVTFFSFPQANPDGFDHQLRPGRRLFAFEDQTGIGDGDFDDVEVRLAFPTLDPVGPTIPPTVPPTVPPAVPPLVPPTVPPPPVSPPVSPPPPPPPPPPTGFPTFEILPGLPGWTVETTGGTGTVAEENGTAVIREGTAFSVSLARTFTAPSAAAELVVELDPTAFDRTDPGGIRDAFEMAILNPTRQPLVFPFAPGRDAYYNRTEGQPEVSAAGVTVSGSVVTLSLTGLRPGEPATVMLRHVNNDGDTNSETRIRSVVMRAATTTAPSGVIPPAEAAGGTGFDFAALADVSPGVLPVSVRTSLRDVGGVLYADLTLRNEASYEIRGPVLVAVDELGDPSVTAAEPDGVTPDGRPYFDFTPALPGGNLPVGAESAPRTVRFNNPNGHPFTHRFSVLGMLNRSPGYTSTPENESLVGQTYRYAATAADPDGDPLAFTLTGAPPGAAVDSAGVVTWAPHADDTGTHAVRLRVSDGRGGFAEQAFTVTVRATVPNRPPVFTSEPPVDATVAAFFERVDVPVGKGPAGVAVSDFGAGTLSLATANAGTQNVSVAKGTGDGTFAPRADWGVGELVQDPTRTFVEGRIVEPGFTYSWTYENSVHGVARADFDGDGFLDLAANLLSNDFPNAGYVTIHRGHGDGSFQDPQRIALATTPVRQIGYGLLAKDFDRDGKADLLLAVPASQAVLFLRGLGNGTFAAPVASAAGGQAIFVQAADLNADGVLDLVTGNQANNTASVLLGNGDGTFAAPTTFATGSHVTDFALSDLDGVNGLDLLAVSYNNFQLEAYLNDGTGQFGAAITTPTRDPQIIGASFRQALSVFVADFDGDTVADVTYTLASGWVGFVHGHGDGTFGDASFIPGVATESDRPSSPYRFYVENEPLDLNADGRFDFVFGTAGRGNVVTVGLGRGDGTFETRQYVGTPGVGLPVFAPQTDILTAIVPGDFNADGVTDLAIGSQFGTGTNGRPGGLSILPGLTPGTFHAPSAYSVGSPFVGYGHSSELGDLDNDGDLDLLTRSGHAIETRLNRGDGTFGPAFVAAPIPPGTGGGELQELDTMELTDFNADGFLDAVWTGAGGVQGSTGPRYLVALGNGDGTFAYRSIFFPPTNTNARNVTTGDFNADGLPDIASRVADFGAVLCAVEVWTNNPASPGTFTQSALLDVGPAPDNLALAAGDFDGDGTLDIATHARTFGGNPDRLLVFRGNGDGTFAAPLTQTLGVAGMTEFAVGDLNRDGNLDLVGVGPLGGHGTHVLLGHGDGTFGPVASYPVGDRDVSLADLTGDGILDIALVHYIFGFPPYSAVVLRGRGDGTFGAPEVPAVIVPGSSSVDASDLNGDGLSDVVHRETNGDQFNTVYLSAGPGLQAVATGDLDGDGKTDLLAANAQTGHVKVLLGNGDHTFRRRTDLLVGGGPVAVTMADLNGDGKLDVVTANRYGDSVTVLRNLGGGQFARTDLAARDRTSGVAVGDLTGDGRPDLAAVNEGDSTVSLFVQQPDGSFVRTDFTTGLAPQDVVLVDADGDGKLDLAVTSRGGKSVVIHRNTGGGTFATPIVVSAGLAPGKVAAGDVNGDGRADLVATFPDDDRVGVLYGQGGGQFTRPQFVSVGDRPTGVKLADLDGDGRTDLVVSSATSNAANVILSRFDPAAVYNYHAKATDADGDALTFTLLEAPGGMAIDAATGQVTWAPNGEQYGDHVVTVEVSDGRGGVATQTYTIAVGLPRDNHAPVILSDPETAVAGTRDYEYQLRVLDPDGDRVHAEMTAGPDGMTFDPHTGRVAWNPRGSHLTFDGVRDTATIPATAALHNPAFTIEAWLRFDAGDGQVILNKPVGSSRSSFKLYLYGFGTHIVGEVSNGTDVWGLSFPLIPTIGRWYHVAYTYDDAADTHALYLNGVQQSIDTVPVSVAYDFSPITFTQFGIGGQHPFHGALDELRFWSRARSAAEIAADFTRALRGDEPGLAAYYRLDDRAGRIGRDSAGNNDLALGGNGILLDPDRMWAPSFALARTETVRLRVRDARGAESEQTFTVTVETGTPATITGTVYNDANADGSRQVEVGVGGRLVFLDRNGTGLFEADERSATTAADGTYSFADLTPGTYTVAVRGLPGWRPSPDSVATVTVVAGQTATADLGVTQLGVVAGDRGPVIVSVAPATAEVGDPLRYNVLVRNLDGRPLTFDLVVKPDGLAIDPLLGVLVWTPLPDQVGEQRVLLRVRDDRGLVDIQDLTLTVAPANTLPVIVTRPPDGPAGVGLPFTYRVRAIDADGDAITFLLGATPAGVTIDAATGVLNWSPTAGQVGPHTLRVLARDARGGESAQSFTLTVELAPVNRNPEILSAAPTGVAIGGRYRYEVAARDRNGDPLTFALEQAPVGMTVNDDGVVTWIADQLGVQTVRLVVRDGRGGEARQTIFVEVRTQARNAAPVVTSRPASGAVAGSPFAYDLVATDPDGDPLRYLLVQGPSGMAIDELTGALRWTPQPHQLGPTPVRVRVIDPFGGEVDQAFTVIVRGVNVPPRITSRPPTEGAVGQTYSYLVGVASAEGDTLAFSLTAAPLGMAIDPATGVITWTPDAGQAGPHRVTIRVATSRGAATQSFEVVVASGSPNRPPIITSSPPLFATVGAAYGYTVAATDPDGQPLTYELRQAPIGVAINAATGELSWTPTAEQVGDHVVVVAAVDPGGAAGLQSFTLRVGATNAAPVIVSAARAVGTAGALYAYDVSARDADGDPLTFELTGPAGMTIDLLGRVRWRSSATDLGTHPVTITVRDARGAATQQSFLLELRPDTEAPRIAIFPSRQSGYPGDTTLVHVRAADNVGVVGLTFTVNGKAVALDAQGTATLTFAGSEFGDWLNLFAMATDAAGNSAATSNRLRVLPLVGEGIPTDPQLAITSPAEGGTVTGPVEVIGTANVDNFQEYRLLVRPADGTTFTEFARGITAVTNGVLGTFDPTLLQNDSYVLRLEGYDLGGGMTFVEQAVNVSGELKLGNFRLSFADLTVPVSGIPVTVARTYDTLQAGRDSDFGYGWRMEFRNADLRTSVGRSGLEDFGLYAPFRPGTRVYITLPGGKREGFTFTPDAQGIFDLVFYRPRFTPDRGVTSRLTVQTAGLVLNGNEFYTLGGQPYNPAGEEFGGGYTLTTKDGTAYRINGFAAELSHVTDRNANRLTFTNSGVVSSTGVSVTFERDVQGRITAAIDPLGNRVSYAYDAAGNLATVTDREGNVTRFEYRTDPAHYLDRVIDPLGRSGVRAEYGPDGRLTGTLDALGNGVSVNYDPSNSLITTHDRLGNPTVNEYDMYGNIMATTDPLGHVTRYTYDASHRLTTETDPLGRTFRYEYDARGNATVVTDPLGHAVRASYDGFGNPLSLTNPLGHTTLYAYDTRGNPTRRTDPTGAVTTFVTDTRGQLTLVTGPRGETTSYAYNAAGRLTSVTDATGLTVAVSTDAVGNTTGETRTFATRDGTLTATWTYQFDTNGELVSATGPNGQPSTVLIDDAGQTTGLTNAGRPGQTIGYSLTGEMTEITGGGQGATIERDAEGRQTVVTLSDGRVVRYEYDAAGREVAVWLPDGSVRRTQYDAAGQPTSTTQGAAGDTREYDAAGRVIALTGADGYTTHYEYDAAGNLTRVTDGLGGTATYEYDEANRLIATTDATGRRATATYDLAGNVVAATDFFGETRTYQYDLANRRVAATDAAGHTTHFSYDGQSLWDGTTDPLGRLTEYAFRTDGQLARRTLPLGQTERFTYDALSRLVTRTDFAGRETNYTYDAAGRIATVANADGTRTFEYDAAGNPAAITDTHGRTAFRIDEYGRLLEYVGPDGPATSFAYTLAGLPVQVSTGTGSAARTTTRTFDPSTQAFTSATDPFGGTTVYTPDPSRLIVGVQYPGGVTLSRTRDALGRPVTLTYETANGSVLLQLTYRYDANGRIDRITQTGGPVTDYSYDTNGRLITESVTQNAVTQTTHYEYDAAGNLTRRTEPDGTSTAFAVDANDRLTGDGTWTYTYDANGNMIRRTSALATEEYTYDARNRLIRVVRTGDGAFDVQYVYDADGLLAERRAAGGVVRYVWDRSTAFPQLLEERDGNGALLRRYESDGMAVTQVIEADGTRRILLTDVQGSPRMVVAATGQVLGQTTYSAYGRTTGNGLVGFTNGLADSLTGLLFLRSRWYAPGLARFMTTDSAAMSQANPESVNRYAYVQGDPVNFTDPSGQELVTLAAIVAYIGIATVVSAGLWAVGAGAVTFKTYGAGGLFVSFREMMKNLRTYQTGSGAGATFKSGIVGVEYVTFDPHHEASIFAYIGGAIGFTVGSPVYGLGVYDTPRADLYEGVFWSVQLGAVLSIPFGLFVTGEQNPISLLTGTTLAWSPTPAFWSDGNGHFVSSARDGYDARYSHTISGVPFVGASFGVSYYFQLLTFGERWSDTRLLPNFFFGDSWLLIEGQAFKFIFYLFI